MRFRTEDLLTLRDGEPMEAGLRARLDGDPDAARASAALERRRRELMALPDVTPAPRIDARVLAAMRAAARVPRPRRVRALAVVAAAAGFAAAATLWITLDRDPAARPDAGGTRAAASRGATPTVDYGALLDASARLERALSALPVQRTVMSAGTAATIATLEDRIALIDAELTYASAAGVRDDYPAQLLRERVDVMNALVQVRYAQSRLFTY